MGKFRRDAIGLLVSVAATACDVLGGFVLILAWAALVRACYLSSR